MTDVGRGTLLERVDQLDIGHGTLLERVDQLGIGRGTLLERVDKFCYQVDTLDADGGYDSAMTE